MSRYTPAEKQKQFLKIGFAGPTGSGKTYSALLMARGLVGPEGRIAFMDTEQSASFYADVTPFCVAEIRPPFESSDFVSAIRDAVREGFDALIIDSWTHMWKGILGFKDDIDSNGGSKWSNWREPTKRFEEAVDEMIQARLHIICCMRSKMQYVQTKNTDGSKEKSKVEAIGAQPIMRDDQEYEFGLYCELDHTHHATPIKDRTRQFEIGRPFKVDMSHGERLREWSSAGVDVSDLPKHPPTDPIQSKDMARQIAIQITMALNDASCQQELDQAVGMVAKHSEILTEEYKEQLRDVYRERNRALRKLYERSKEQ